MPVSIIVGGQLGSEGKGKAVYYWVNKLKAKAVVRVGGSNSGHIVYDSTGRKHAFRNLSVGTVLPDVKTIIPDGGFVDVEVLSKELKSYPVSPTRLRISPLAMLIQPKHKHAEDISGLRKKIASTLSGTGAALIDRVSRSHDTLLARDCDWLQPYLCDVNEHIRKLLDAGEHIVLEGTQGYGLSVDYKYYPYCTSRYVTASGFMSEAGISPFDVENIIMVIRTFPIRVGGNSGPMYKEITWDDVTRISGSQTPISEMTTVTKTVRRVGMFDASMVRDAIICNRPNIIMMNHVDYLDATNKGNNYLTDKQKVFVNCISKQIGQHIDYCGNGEMLFVLT